MARGFVAKARAVCGSRCSSLGKLLLRLGIVALLGICSTALSPRPAGAQTVEQFYKGRTVTLFVASAPGGINDLTARLIAKHMVNFLAGKPTIVVQNLSGANGLALANRLYVNTEKDGSADRDPGTRHAPACGAGRS